MKIAIKISLSILIFVASAYLSFVYEHEYRRFIRWLYEIISNHKISFHHPRKYIHFASGLFIFSIAIFLVTIFLSSIRLKWQKILLNAGLSIVLFVSYIIGYAFIDSKLKLIECTMCDNGLRTLKYDDIAYDQIMVMAIVFAFMPWLISEFKIWRRNRMPIIANKL